MNKKILMLRHAKSSWDDPSLRDHDRPLNSRGLRDAANMAKWLADHNLRPAEIFCSTALRTRQTAEPLLKIFGLPEEFISWRDELYFSGDDTYLQAIHSAAGSSDLIFLIGHNPMTESVINLLSSQPIRQPIKTATAALLNTNTKEWSEVGPGSCSLDAIITPQDFHKPNR